jgi:hypothetical protein
MRPQPQGGEPVQIEDMTDVSLHARINSARASLKRRRRIIVSVAGTLLAIGAFLAWGPFGIGSGPVLSGSGALTLKAPVPRHAPAMLNIELDAGASNAIVDGIELHSDGRFPPPRSMRIFANPDAVCAQVWAPLLGPHGFYAVCTSNGRGKLGPLIGHSIPRLSRVNVPGLGPVTYPGEDASIEVGPPGAAGCWMVTSVAIHYHVGIRHYTAAVAVEIAGCWSNAQFAALRFSG